MIELLHELKDWLKPETIINAGGIFLLCFVIFAETGLLIGFFLPGDSLLFTAGLLAAVESPDTPGKAFFDINIFVLLFSVFICAVIGNLVGYAFGSYSGPRLFKRNDSLIFKKKYLETTERFYEKHGAMALIGGRFIPIIRTFVPILAGAIKLNFNKFVLYNILGGFLWVFSMILIGYGLGSAFPQIKDYLEPIVIGLILITLIPVIRTYLRERKLSKEQQRGN